MEDSSGPMQVWAHMQGKVFGTGDKVEVVSKAKELIVEVHGSGLIAGPTDPEEIAAEIPAIGGKVQARKMK